MRVLIGFVATSLFAISIQSAELKHHSLPSSSAQEYLSVQEWALAHQLQICPGKEKDEIKLTNRWHKVGLKINSQRADINGIDVFLSNPIGLRQGTAAIAQRDVDRTLDPILFPEKNSAKQLVKTLAIGAGHGGKDCGYQVGSQQEKKYTLLLAKELETLAHGAGFKTVLLRSSDRFIELEDRPRVAKRSKADVYLELHFNCANPGNTETQGVEVYCLTPPGAISTNGGTEQYPGPLHGNRHDERNILLAYQMQSALVNGVGLADRGVRRARFVVLRDAEMPTALIEGGFMSHPEEMRRIQDAHCRKQTAQAILDGLLAYKRLIER